MFITIYWILNGLLIIQIKAQSQVNAPPPVPGLPPNTDPVDKNEPEINCDSYIAPTMQAMAYYLELIQYENVYTVTREPPFTGLEDEDDVLSSSGTSSTSSTTTTTMSSWWSSKKPTQSTTPRTTTTSSTTTSSPWYVEQTTVMHNPGIYAPNKPPIYFDEHLTEDDIDDEEEHKAQVGALPILSISNNQFFEWFLQNKEKVVSDEQEINLQYLHQLPGSLLQDIQRERYEQPAQSDEDNIKEFLKVYDDHYGLPISGKKKVPPTKPYVQFLLTYDILKRDAKKYMLNKCEGYSEAMVDELHKTSLGSAQRQLYTLMNRMIKRNHIEKADILARIKSIMEDLRNQYSVTAQALQYLPTLEFLPVNHHNKCEVCAAHH